MELGERRKRGQGLTRPELAVLLAYAKLSLYGDLLDSAVPDDPYLGRELARYFPSQLSERFADALERHRLRREIISTQLTNSMINRGGPAFVARIADQTGAPAADDRGGVLRRAQQLRHDRAQQRDRCARHARSPASCSSISTRRSRTCCSTASSGSCAMSTCRRASPKWSSTIAPASRRSRPRCTTCCRTSGGGARDARAAELTNAGVPADLARTLASLPALAAAPDIIWSRTAPAKPVADVAATYFAAGAFFQLDRIANAARGIHVTDYFDRLALDRALDSIGEAERRLTAAMVGNGVTGPAAVEAWVGAARAATSSASAPRCTASPAPASRCRSCRSRRACSVIW